MKPREYQRRAVNEVMRLFRMGRNRVCLVAPTGAGKTFMFAMAVERCREAKKRAAAIAHRGELVDQLRSRTGVEWATTIQSLQGEHPDIDLLILDECHHYVSDDWQRVFAAFPRARVLGGTATPQRGDGRPLGAVFQELVVAAHYSELLDQGFLVPCDMQRAAKLMAPDLAMNPVAAWIKYGEGRRGFMFCRTIMDAAKYEHDLLAMGIKAAMVTAETHPAARARTVTRFREGKVDALVNVYTMTEGIDVPEASLIVLARGCTHASTYLQMVGRAARPSPGKKNFVFIDLPGVSHVHGEPLEDRVYSLDKGILLRRSDVPNVTECARCGYADSKPWRECPRCHFVMPEDFKTAPKIYNEELRRVWAGADTPMTAKEAECQRLISVAEKQNYDYWWAAREYRKLFGEGPPGGSFTLAQKRAELNRQLKTSKSRPQAIWKFRDTFGHWPPREWIR